MTFYVCKQCDYKHTFLPFACAKCKGKNFYPLITSELAENTCVHNGMEIQEDVLKLRIENEQLKKQLTEAKEMFRELIKNSPDTYSGTNIELQQKKMFAFQNAVNKAEAFINKE